MAKLPLLDVYTTDTQYTLHTLYLTILMDNQALRLSNSPNHCKLILELFCQSCPVLYSGVWYIRPETRETNPFLEELVGGYGPCVQCHCPSPYKKST